MGQSWKAWYVNLASAIRFWNSVAHFLGHAAVHDNCFCLYHHQRMCPWLKVGHGTNKYLCYKWKCPPKSKNANTKLLGTQQNDSARCFSLAPNLYETKVVKDTRPSRTFCEFIGHDSPTSNKIFQKNDENSYLQRCFYCFIFCRGFIVSGSFIWYTWQWSFCLSPQQHSKPVLPFYWLVHDRILVMVYGKIPI